MQVKKWSLGALVVGGILIGGCSLLMSKPDNPMEQAAENMMERKLEQWMGVEDGSFEGVIDLSPWADEAKLEVKDEVGANVNPVPCSFDEDC